MKTTMKTLIASFALFAVTGLAQAQDTVRITEINTNTVEPTVQVTEMDVMPSNLGPGYSDSIDMADIQQLDETVAEIPEFEQPNNFMSDEGVYRYAYYEKTGVWLSLNEARDALNMETPAENY